MEHIAVAMATRSASKHSLVLSCSGRSGERHGEEVDIDDSRPVPHTRVSLHVGVSAAKSWWADLACALLGGAHASLATVMLCAVLTVQVLRLCAPVQIPDRRNFWLPYAQAADRPQSGVIRQPRPWRHSALAEQDQRRGGGAQQPSVLLPYPQLGRPEVRPTDGPWIYR